MANTVWNELKTLVLVAAHAVHRGLGHDDVKSDAAWYLWPFQRNETWCYVAHIQAAVEFAAQDPLSMVMFTGTSTRADSPLTEGMSYWLVAEQQEWWGQPGVRCRAVTEDYAVDSPTNLLYGLARFRELTGNYPQTCRCYSWAMKEVRFQLHREALRFPIDRFVFCPVLDPPDPAAREGENKARSAFAADPYGYASALRQKKRDRNPFRRTPPYAQTCPELKELLAHEGPEMFTGPLPW